MFLYLKAMNSRVVHFIIAGTVGLIVTIFFGLGIFDSWQAVIVDRLLPASPPDKRAVIVALDKRALEKFGTLPWPAATLATVLRQFEPSKPAVVAIIPSIINESANFSGDDKLKSLLEGLSYRLVLPVRADERHRISPTLVEAIKIIKPPSFFTQFSQISYGHPYFSTDDHITIRSLPPVLTRKLTTYLDVRGQGEYYEPIAYESAIRSRLSSDKIEPVNGLLLYSGKAGNVPTFSLADLDSGALNKDFFNNKIVFVGLTGTSSARTLSAPSSFGKMEDVEIHAQLASMLLQPRKAIPVVPIDPLSGVARLFVAALVPAFSIQLFRSRRGIVLSNSMIGLLYFVMTAMLARQGQLLPVLYLQVAWFFSLVLCFGYLYWIKNVKQEVFPSKQDEF